MEPKKIKLALLKGSQVKVEYNKMGTKIIIPNYQYQKALKSLKISIILLIATLILYPLFSLTLREIFSSSYYLEFYVISNLWNDSFTKNSIIIIIASVAVKFFFHFIRSLTTEARLNCIQLTPKFLYLLKHKNNQLQHKSAVRFSIKDVERAYLKHNFLNPNKSPSGDSMDTWPRGVFNKNRNDRINGIVIYNQQGGWNLTPTLSDDEDFTILVYIQQYYGVKAKEPNLS